MKDPGVLQREATTRFLTDPVFHARVKIACSLTEWTARQEGITLTMAQYQSIRQSCAYGVLVTEYEIDDMEAAERSMLAAAHAMGMTVRKNGPA